MSTRARFIAAATLAPALVAACQEETPTGLGDDAAATPVTIEVELAWSDFGSDLETFGGYGVASELGIGVVAADFGGTLNARTLIRFGRFPESATVRDSTGTNRTDSLITFPSGRLIAHFDTVASTPTAPVTLGLGAIQNEWHPPTVSWLAAVDTIGDQQLWPSPGAGDVVDLGTAVWDPAAGDSVIFQLDSAELAAWSDTTDLSSGARLELLTAGERLRMRSAVLRLDAQASIADTVVSLLAGTRAVTFVYDPPPQAPTDGVRIGGAPSWRTILDVALPAQITGPPEFCAAVGCPHALEAGEISYAALVLTSSASAVAFQPTDSIGLDVRPVFERAAMPKAPLGGSLVNSFLGRRVAAEAFGAQPGEVIEVPVTLFVRDLAAGPTGGVSPPNTLALLSVIEPLSIAFASFAGPGGAGEPRLRLVLTIGSAVELP